MRLHAIQISAAVSMAMSNSPVILKAKEKLNEATAKASSTASSLLPTVNAIAEADYKKDSLLLLNPLFGGQPYNLYGVGFQARQPIFAGVWPWTILGVARKQLTLAQIEFETARRDLTLQVLKAFYTVLLNERAVQILVDTEKAEKEFLATAEHYLAIGRAHKLDILQFRTQLALLRPQILQAQAALQVSGFQLATLLGDANSARLEITGSLKTPDVRSFPKAAKPSSLLEIEHVEEQRRQLDDSRDISLAAHWPQLAAIGGFNAAATEKTKIFDQDGRSWVFGVQLTIPLFSGLSSVFDRRVLAAQESQLALDEKSTRDSLALAQLTAERDLQLSQALLEADVTALNEAREADRVARRDYGLGTATYLQLFDSIKNLLNAELAYNQASFDAIINSSKYFTAYGMPLDKLVEQLDHAVK
jgi:outer membrane protein TolC